ncbi:hypothetical protein FGIG_03201 [Fasciola gigantica]|uniref:Uncharacterized protein n=1 Tax=Fasciola gigantica TaxID=46835 RepID=A0A504YNQ4_FASGI|nr:hypothetical protein FGIG_03201 [Fasciola gigantica]
MGMILPDLIKSRSIQELGNWITYCVPFRFLSPFTRHSGQVLINPMHRLIRIHVVCYIGSHAGELSTQTISQEYDQPVRGACVCTACPKSLKSNELQCTLKVIWLTHGNSVDYKASVRSFTEFNVIQPNEVQVNLTKFTHLQVRETPIPND